MDLVIDANVVFSALIKDSFTYNLLFNDTFHLFTPEYIFEEFEKHKSEIIEKTQRNSEDFNNLTNILKKRINTISNEETERFIMAAKKISPDPDDIDYFALALKIKCPIWSQDKKLKLQKKIIKYTLQKK